MVVILVVEDDESIAFGLTEGLTRAGHQVQAAGTLAQARAMAGPKIQLALLDWNLPDGTGFALASELKARRLDVPIIFLTVRDDEQDVVRALDAGADDYITKPFKLAVLLARIDAVLRRCGPGNARLACGELALDREAARVFQRGEEVELSAGEYRLLLMLMENKNRTLSRQTLLARLWDDEGDFVNDNTLTVTMKRLRQKLGEPESIRTVRGIGYRLEEP